MACIEANLKEFLLASDTVRDACHQQIFAGHAPANTPLPFIVLRPINNSPAYHLGNEAGIVDAVIQVDAYHNSRPECDLLAEAIRNRLSGYQGDAGDTYIDNAEIITESVFNEAPRNGSDKWVRQVSTDYRIFYTRSVPTHL